LSIRCRRPLTRRAPYERAVLLSHICPSARQFSVPVARPALPGAQNGRKKPPAGQKRPCTCGIAPRHRMKPQKTPALARKYVFHLDITAAFMYKSRVSMGHVNACCRAVASPCPTVFVPRQRQRERITPGELHHQAHAMR